MAVHLCVVWSGGKYVLPLGVNIIFLFYFNDVKVLNNYVLLPIIKHK